MVISPYVVVPVLMVSAVVIAYYSYQNSQTICGVWKSLETSLKGQKASDETIAKTLEVIRADQQIINQLLATSAELTKQIQIHQKLLDTLAPVIAISLSQEEVTMLKGFINQMLNREFGCSACLQLEESLAKLFEIIEKK